jgi:hypothetical protein
MFQRELTASRDLKSLIENVAAAMQTLRSFHSKMEASKSTVQRPRRRALRKAPGELLPARVQKSYFMLSSPKRDLLNTALESPKNDDPSVWERIRAQPRDMLKLLPN